MSDYEKQVVKLIKFKPNDYADHQDYLAALIRATDKWLAKHDPKGDIFAGWDDGLANWFDLAASAMNSKGTIPDFPDREVEEPIEPDAEDEESTEDQDDCPTGESEPVVAPEEVPNSAAVEGVSL